MKLATGLVLIGLVCSSSLATEPVQRTLTFDERVTAQKAIEQVYWNHRIWPKENPHPKPTLSMVMSDDAIRAKVADSLRKSNALGTWWERPITGEQLQAELDRIVKGSHDPQVLQELFAALGNDPYLIAETLGRQTLADRLIRSWYANDARLHAAVRAEAERALAECTSTDCMKSMGGEYRETTLKLRGQADDPQRNSGHELALDSTEWKTALDRLAAQLGVTPDSIPIGRLSRVEETADAFVVSVVLARKQTEIVTASVVWTKQPFDSWLLSTPPSNTLDFLDKSVGFTLPALPKNGCQDDTWSLTPQDFPDARDLHTAVWTGTEMIVWGGEYFGVLYNTGGRYNPSTDSWTSTSMRTGVPERRYAHTAVWTGTEMIVWGGSNDQRTVNTGGRYDPTVDVWRPTSTGVNVPGARVWHTAVWTGTEMIVWGGIAATYVNSGGRYNPSTDSWLPTSMGANAPTARNSHTAVWTGAEMIVWGGYFYDGNDHYLNTGGRYNPSTDSWMATSVSAFASGRRRHTAVWTGSEMIVWGGLFEDDNVHYLITGGRYNPTTDSWTATSTATNLPTGRAGHTAIWTGTEVLIWGGSTRNVSLNTGGLYNPSSNTWRATSVGANVPTPRAGHSSVWTGTEMIVWGGSGQVPPYYTAYMSTGARYNPISNTWVPTSSGQTVPAARVEQTSIWTGAEFCVWGGFSWEGTYTYFNTGGCYDPPTDSWTPTSIDAGTPAARYGHTAIWTGTEMIVWGGSDSASSYDTGGRYSPMSGAWTATSRGANVPAARRGHTAVWTGSQMIVWGGQGGDYLNTGGRYEPSHDSWLPTSTGSNAPSARYLHTAVWTGTEMIVWGGYIANPSSNYLKTGGRYDPSMDIWTPTSVGTNVPVPRESHTAVWTGAEMIIWGGWIFDNGYYYYNTGGRYSPSANTWRATSIGANVPEARSNHTAVWTGLEMIVWGGYRYNVGVMDTGGRYSPFSDSWTPTTTASTMPSEREKHSAAWTGVQMIVWGGVPYTSTGARYCAHTRCFDDAGPVNCDDGNPCTDDSCDPATGCVHVDNPDPCDDGNPCTSNDACNEGLCIGHSGCEDGLPCTDDVADPALGCACSNPVSSAGTACIDGNRCTLGTVCDGLGGAQADCGGGTPLDCEDGNPCTDDSCDRIQGCIRTPNTAPCDYGNLCTVGDTCGGGTCNPGTPRNCDDVNVCNGVENCDPASGCVAGTPVYCDDGNACNGVETCAPASGCVAGTPPNCDDGNLCTNDSCYTSSGCFHTYNSNACNDGNACTIGDTCSSGTCIQGVPVVCNDGNLCTTDTCNTTVGCAFTNNTSPCNDGNACTTGDACGGGTCLGGAPFVCLPSDQCHLAGTCDPAEGACSDPVKPDGSACDDGNPCAARDTCRAGVCNPGTQDACDDDNPCTTDSCNAATTWTERFPAQSPPARDRAGMAYDSATGQLVLFSGAGIGNSLLGDTWTWDGTSWTQQIPASSPSARIFPSMAFDSSSSQLVLFGGMVNGGLQPNDTWTWDGVTWNRLSPVTRPPGRFEASLAYDAGTSQLVLFGGLAGTNTALNDTWTWNGTTWTHRFPASSPPARFGASMAYDASTGQLVLFGGHGSGQTYLGDTWTWNGITWTRMAPTNSPPAKYWATMAYDSATGQLVLFGGLPAEGEVVPDMWTWDGSTWTRQFPATSPPARSTAAMAYDTGNGQLVLFGGRLSDVLDDTWTYGYVPVPACANTPTPGPTCNDGNACTTDDTCTADGTCVGVAVSACNDDNPCTDDTCDPAFGCVFTNNANPCDDGNACTTNDTCGGGTCNPGAPLVCSDNNPCTDDSCDVATGCVHTNNTNACDDENHCTTNDTCRDGSCIGGAPPNCADGNPCTDDRCSSASGCVHDNNTASCSDRNACTIDDVCGGGVCHSGAPVICTSLDQCHAAGVCNPADGICSNPVQPDGVVCNDDNLCTAGETCQTGTCMPSFSGLNRPRPRTSGYYHQLCEKAEHGQVPYHGDQIVDADAVCVASLAAAFNTFRTAADLCAVIDDDGARDHQHPGDHHPYSHECFKAEDELIATALNICRARVCEAQNVDSRCGADEHQVTETTVAVSFGDANTIVANPSRTKAMCKQARCELKEINNGHALEMNSVLLAKDAQNVRLSWSAMDLEDGSGVPDKYEVWRRPLNSSSKFKKIGETTTALTFLDTTVATGTWEYEVTADIP